MIRDPECQARYELVYLARLSVGGRSLLPDELDALLGPDPNGLARRERRRAWDRERGRVRNALKRQRRQTA